ncbi:HAD family hydrolase [Kribbella sp. NPDC026611]|uniref:HAD family hydrolase n=1 Tax=Kribbella sp. NPDC026611 TaxID=3154911 RepID=UPI0033FCCEDC
MTPRLVCFDLDNTLIDRDAAFLKWARWWAGVSGLDESAVDWLVAHDNGGFRPRTELFALARKRFVLAAPVEELVASYNEEHPLFTWVEPAVLDGLAELRAAGWRVAVVTNGETAQQDLKLEYTQLVDAVDHVCVSGTVGVRKPDRRIFELAAAGAGAGLDGGWMVGDHPAYDIAGGINAGLHTILIGGRTEEPAADHRFDSVLDVFPLILSR